jgi:hypothetical protein
MIGISIISRIIQESKSLMDNVMKQGATVYAIAGGQERRN